ncbi:hypothetical protein [Streptomyces sp. NPDC058086]|uniref:hypothetical protein n=1 Tax=Streptomyces sp. NPDC058086 TaxID=3346334 RepID=UPI0036E827FB
MRHRWRTRQAARKLRALKLKAWSRRHANAYRRLDTVVYCPQLAVDVLLEY